MPSFLKNFISRNTKVQSYGGGGENGVVFVDVIVFGVFVSRTKIHPRMGTYGNVCGMPSCDGIHRAWNLHE